MECAGGEFGGGWGEGGVGLGLGVEWGWGVGLSGMVLDDVREGEEVC